MLGMLSWNRRNDASASNTFNTSSFSMLENAILKNIPRIIGKANVQKTNILFLNNVFIVYFKL